MKTTASKLSFGFSPVVSGQRKTVDTPELVALTTSGGFRISRAVSRALGIQHGEYIQFINNLDNVQAAIAAKSEDYLEFCSANGFDAESEAATLAYHKENDMWGLVKGYPLYNEKGIAQTCTERMTKADREAYAAAHYDELLAVAQESGSDEVKDAIAAADGNTEEIIKVLALGVSGEEKQKYSGSKTANTSAMIGTGVVLNFTDSNVWSILKQGADEGKARKFPLDLEGIVTVELPNGYENITVPCIPFKAADYEDVDSARNKSVDEDAE